MKHVTRQFIIGSFTRCASRLLVAVVATLLMLLLHRTAFAQSPYPQRADRQINDYARVLTDADKATIRSAQTLLLRERGVELVVVTINSINNYDVADKTIEAFATNLFNNWGIGDRQRNDGVLLLVAVKDRKVRIEVGSGYGASYDGPMQHVVDDDILPFFRRGEYGKGIARGVLGIEVALTAAPSRSSTFLSSPPFLAGVLIVGVVVVLGITKATLRLYRRQRTTPRQHVVVMCKDCRRPMDELGIDLVNADLDAGQRVELQLGSVNYQLWECRDCGSRKRQSSPRTTFRYRACPKCRYRTLEEDEQVTRPPSATGRGLKVTTRRCHHCGYSAEFKTKLAQKRAVLGRSAKPASGASAFDTSNSSSSSYGYSSDSSYDYGSTSSYDSGSSSSDSGGSSSGDGASGSW